MLEKKHLSTTCFVYSLWQFGVSMLSLEGVLEQTHGW